MGTQRAVCRRSRCFIVPVLLLVMVLGSFSEPAWAQTRSASPSSSSSESAGSATQPTASASATDDNNTSTKTTSTTRTASSTVEETDSERVSPSVTGDSGTHTASESDTARSRTLLPSATSSVEASESVSATFAGDKWLCRNIALKATLQAVSPRLGPPVNAGPNAVVRTTETIIRDVGLIIAANISSCHRFFLEASEMIPNVVRNTSEDGIASAGTAPEDVLNLLLAGSPANVVADTGAGVGSFARLAEQNPALLTFTPEGPTSGFFKLGPDPLYGTVDTETTAVQLRGELYMTPPVQEGIRFAVAIDPDVLADQPNERTAAQGLAVAASVLAVIVGTPQTPTIAGRIGSIYAAADCPVFLNAETPPRTDQNILSVAFGSERRLQWVAGAAVYNPLVVVAASCSIAFVVAAGAFLLGKPLEDAMALTRFPGVVVPLVMFVFQGTIYGAGATIGESREFIPSFFGFVAIMLAAGFVGTIAIVTIPPRSFDRFALRIGIVTAARPLHPALKLCFGAGRWIDRTARPFVGPMGGLFKEFSPERRWFLCVEIGVSLLLGTIEATLPSTPLQCIIANTAQALVLWLHLVVVIGAHPYVAPPAFVVTILTSLCLLVAAVIAATGPSIADPARRQSVVDAIDGLLLAAACFSLVKGLLDCAAAGFRFVMIDELRSRGRAWQTDSFRRMRMRLEMERERRRVGRALDDAVGSDDLASTASDVSLDEAAHVVAEERASNRTAAAASINPDWGVPPRVLQVLEHFDDRAATSLKQRGALSTAATPDDVAADAEQGLLDGAADDDDGDSHQPHQAAATSKRKADEVTEAVVMRRTGMTRAEILQTL